MLVALISIRGWNLLESLHRRRGRAGRSEGTLGEAEGRGEKGDEKENA